MKRGKSLYILSAVIVLLSMIMAACQQATPTMEQAPLTAPTQAEVEKPQPTAEVVKPDATEEPHIAPQISVGLSNEPSKMEPAINSGTAQRTVKLLVYRGLFNYGKGGVLTPELADKYEISDDGLIYTFTLRDALFHNGDPVTAADVKFTLERILDPEIGATFYKQMSIISSVNIIDEKTVEVVLSKPMSPFLDYLALPESVIVSKKWTEEKGGDLSTYPMGAGPYIFKEYLSGQRINLEKFDNFYKENLPITQNIVFYFYSDANMRVTALQAGDVDLIEYVPWKDVEMIKSDSNLKVLGGVGPFMGLTVNTYTEELSNPLVRQAISYAIDRQVIIDTAFSGQGIPIYGMAMPSSSLAYDEKYIEYFSYDPEKAKELLAQAGYPDGFSVRLLATSQYDFHQNTAIAVQSELEKVGIKVELDLPDWPTRLDKNLKADYDLMVLGTSGDVADPDFLATFFEGGEIRLDNSPGFADPIIDDLLSQGRATSDPVERKAIYSKLQERILELCPIIFLMWRDQSYGANAMLEGFEPLPGFLSFQSGIMLEVAYKNE